VTLRASVLVAAAALGIAGCGSDAPPAATTTAAPALERLRIIFPEGLNVREMGDRVAAVRRIDEHFNRRPGSEKSYTFHGRDIFAPVAARLAAGDSLAGSGEPLDPAELASLVLPRAQVEGDALVAHALTIDRFGNVQLDAAHEDVLAAGLSIGQQVELCCGTERFYAHLARTFADVRPGEIIVYEDAYGALAIAINRGDAAETLQLAADAELRIRPR